MYMKTINITDLICKGFETHDMEISQKIKANAEAPESTGNIL